ncbi:uncharacterized protein UTRI_00967 [Ustilago trichophora]|uniref:Uncharacterized protein n=1 Tax=Ustilago trichophora TaxID=86804 RepID=A0A5C3DYT8_9BASI|nr:uncharacterized protein UTRI_00967 [Ustilago trichophora]
MTVISSYKKVVSYPKKREVVSARTTPAGTSGGCTGTSRRDSTQSIQLGECSEESTHPGWLFYVAFSVFAKADPSQQFHVLRNHILKMENANSKPPPDATPGGFAAKPPSKPPPIGWLRKVATPGGFSL